MTEPVVIAAPAVIPPTHLSFQIALGITEMFEKAGLQVRLLGGPVASRPSFIVALQDTEMDLAMYLGHGSPYALCMEDPFCKAGFNLSDTKYLRNKILVAAPACEVGQFFAPKMIQQGGKAALASVEPMYAGFVEDENDYQADWHDYTLTLYRTMIKETVGDAFQAYQDRCAHFLELCTSNVGQWESADWYINAVRQNRDEFKLFGNAQARVEYTPSTRERNIIEELLSLIIS